MDRIVDLGWPEPERRVGQIELSFKPAVGIENVNDVIRRDLSAAARISPLHQDRPAVLHPAKTAKILELP